MSWLKRVWGLTLYAAGVASFGKRDYERAIRRLSRASHVDVDLGRYEGLLWDLGRSHLALGQTERAIEDLEKARHELMNRVSEEQDGQLDDDEAVEMLTTLRDVLLRSDQPDRAAEVEADLQQRQLHAPSRSV